MNIPQEHQAVMPYLILPDAIGFRDFVMQVFDAQLGICHFRDEDQQAIMHAEVHIGGCTIMFAQATEQFTPQVAGLFIYVEQADASFNKAIEAGARVVMALADQSYGRSGGVADPNGNTWWITSV